MDRGRVSWVIATASHSVQKAYIPSTINPSWSGGWPLRPLRIGDKRRTVLDCTEYIVILRQVWRRSPNGQVSRGARAILGRVTPATSISHDRGGGCPLPIIGHIEDPEHEPRALHRPNRLFGRMGSLFRTANLRDCLRRTVWALHACRCPPPPCLIVGRSTPALDNGGSEIAFADLGWVYNEIRVLASRCHYPREYLRCRLLTERHDSRAFRNDEFRERHRYCPAHGWLPCLA
jgi:hypothetical protein